MSAQGFYRRPLPQPLISFSSSEGRQIFREALEMDGMAGYFPLAEQFHTQAEPAFCGLGTLVIVLNALSIDPGRIWKGIWRWYGEEFLDCCQPLPVVKNSGITFDEFVCLARCNGALATPFRYDHSTLDEFRETVQQTSATPQGFHLVAAYNRQILGQTGEGHFSPLGGYHPQRDLVLIMDVARFKYPPHWVPLPLLWQAFEPLDATTGQCRGYISLRKSTHLRETFFYIALDLQEWKRVAPYFTDIIPTALEVAQPHSQVEVINIILQHLPPDFIEILSTATDRMEIPQELKDTIEVNPLFKLVVESLSQNSIELLRSQLSEFAQIISLLLLSCPEKLYKKLDGELQIWFSQIRQPEQLVSPLDREVLKLREQMAALQELGEIS
ncbi:phytochelatin synthase family protein [Planktothrix paucivesiculata]|uniref:glutathione gamma-glutamylcysteinyltransferase n=1 Tax=Planktothrix paucivesiculata PCC 9631 TaxID=671071 RepID=A0A7Z9BJ61_9CYAN|nr:phytochelatin synthase family protein [Planktothrix paucivesiculata]VXD15281.1 Glutathione gamma-glutamylcysteinyltransferase [Planktothrix paucivesiculata PCC 9631]